MVAGEIPWDLNSFFMMTSWHENDLRITCLLWGIHRSQIASHHWGPVMQFFDNFIVVNFNKLLNKQSSDLWLLSIHVTSLPWQTDNSLSRTLVLVRCYFELTYWGWETHICVSILLQIMVCRLFGAKPLPEPVMTYSEWDHMKHVSMKFYLKF